MFWNEGKDSHVSEVDNTGITRTDSQLQESIEDLVKQLKILNAYMAEGFDMNINEEDL